MKHGKKPTVAQCKFIKSKRLNPADWLVCKDTPELMHLVHRFCSNTERVVYKGGEKV